MLRRFIKGFLDEKVRNGDKLSLKDFSFFDGTFNFRKSHHESMEWDRTGFQEIKHCYLHKTLITRMVAHLFMDSLVIPQVNSLQVTHNW